MDSKFESLRKKAEAFLKNREVDKSNFYYEDIENLIEELNIAQVELEMQNLELQGTNQKLLNEQTKYEDMYLEAPIAYITLNETGNILQINQAAADLIGIPLFQFKYTSIFPYLEEKSKLQFGKYFKTVFHSNKIEFGEVTIVNADNQVIYTKLQTKTFFDTNLNQKLCRLTITDISHEKNKITIEEEKFRILFNSINDAIFLHDLEGNILLVNNTACKNLGYTFQEFLELKISDIEAALNEEQTQKKINDIKNEGEALFESTIKAKNSRTYPVEIHSKTIDLEGRKVGISIARDITERKEAEKKLVELNATKDKFFSIISHDLKNPFNAIMGLSDMLLDNLNKLAIEETRRIVKLISDSGKNTYKLLENLLEWSRAQTGKIDFQPQNIKLKNIVNEALCTSDNQAKAKEINLSMRIDEETLVFADPNMLSTVLRNFVSNAIKFTPRQGKVTINADAEQENQKVKISVSDTGVGMDHNKLIKLFSISEKISGLGTEKETGTGIGLLLCKEFIEKHGSEIHVESELEKGSVFSFYLNGV